MLQESFFKKPCIILLNVLERSSRSGSVNVASTCDFFNTIVCCLQVPQSLSLFFLRQLKPQRKINKFLQQLHLLTMFNRRKSRLEPTYTGVNHVAPSSASPNSNALAAALTIGKAMKQLSPAQPQSSIRRSGSIQYITKPLQQPAKPAAKKQAAKRASMSSFQPQSPRQASSGSFTSSNSRFSLLSSAPTSAQSRPVKEIHNYSNNNHLHENRIVYDVEDGFDESYLDEITNESFLNHNHEKMKDLRLSHDVRTQKSAPVVKMVTKYIPTPSGIKTIQVPESSFKEEVARNNSLRTSGRTSSLRGGVSRSGSRSSSLNSLSAPQRTPARTSQPQKHRTVPASPKMAPMTENVELELALAKKDELLEHKLKMEALDKQIQQEKVMAKQLELKKLEYERLVNERKANESRIYEENTAGVPSNGGTANSRTEAFPSTENAQEFHNRDGTIDEADYTASAKLNEQVSFINPDTSNLSLLSLDSKGHERSYSGDILEGEGHNLAHHLRPTFDSVPEIIEDMKAPLTHALLQGEPDTANFSESTYSDHSIEATESNPEQPPQITVNQVEATEITGSLQLPNNSNSLIHSGGSFDKKMPVKSAMKSSSFYVNGAAPPNKNATGFPKTPTNPAHEVYLSLTTAENTRLNSKLSNTQLDQQVATTPARRKSQSLRAPQTPQVQQEQKPDRPVRSLRPSSFAEMSTKDQGMSGRSLRTSVHVQPISPHPALQLNYQSPSKAKAAELYAKANARPLSVFKSVPRQSSFSKDGEEKRPQKFSMRDEPVGPNRTAEPVSKPVRTTLRQEQQPVTRKQQVLQSQPQQQQAQQPAQNGTSRVSSATPSNSRFRSRFNDSDDEDGGQNGGHFSLRFADSDDESSPIQKLSQQAAFARPAQDAPTLRAAPEEKSSKPKKKFGKLRKLFGKS